MADVGLYTRIPAEGISVFNVGTDDLLDDLEDGTISFDVKTSEGRPVKDPHDYPVPTSRSWKVEATFFISAGSRLALFIAAGSPIVDLVITTEVATYSGTAVITSGDHSLKGGDLQKQKISFMGRGPLTVVPID